MATFLWQFSEEIKLATQFSLFRGIDFNTLFNILLVCYCSIPSWIVHINDDDNCDIILILSNFFRRDKTIGYPLISIYLLDNLSDQNLIVSRKSGAMKWPQEKDRKKKTYEN